MPRLRWMTLFLTLPLLLPTLTSSQPGGQGERFDRITGLERIVARQWTSDPRPGTALQDTVSVWAYQFDTDANAHDAFPSLAEASTGRVTAAAGPGRKATPVGTSVGDESASMNASLPSGTAHIDVGAGIVRVGRVVYDVSGQWSDGNGATRLPTILRQLAGSPPSSSRESFAANGTSHGGVWDGLSAVAEPLTGNATVVDLQVYERHGTPVASPTSGDFTVRDLTSMSDLSSFRTVRSITGTVWDLPADATPREDAPFHAEAYIVTTTSGLEGGFLLYPIADILGLGTTVTHAETGYATPKAVDSGFVETSAYVSGANGRAGKVTIIVRQIGSVLYAVRVDGGHSASEAESLIKRMVADAAIPAGSFPHLTPTDQNLATPAVLREPKTSH